LTNFSEGDENVVQESLRLQAVLLDKSDKFVKVTNFLSNKVSQICGFYITWSCTSGLVFNWGSKRLSNNAW